MHNSNNSQVFVLKLGVYEFYELSFGASDAKVGRNDFMCERKQSNFISIIFISNQGMQHKMLKKRPVATGLLQSICVVNFFICKRKVKNVSCMKI